MLPLYTHNPITSNDGIFSVTNLAVVPEDRITRFKEYWSTEGLKMAPVLKVGDIIEFTSLSVTWEQKTDKHPYWIKKKAKYAKIDKIDLDNDLLCIRPLNEQSFGIQLGYADSLPYIIRPTDKTMKILFGKP